MHNNAYINEIICNIIQLKNTVLALYTAVEG